ncbi:MAG: hypothetical protein FWB86_11875 [Treponema sp.]|nr:hypothetical protein [Treponema sp.]
MNDIKTGDTVLENTDLAKAVKLLEDNGFYVVYADSGLHKKKFTGALAIRAYPKRTTAISCLPDKYTKI